jgi:hypothetical protein
MCLLAVLGLLAGIGGCTRAFYRRAADNEVNDILAEKDKIPGCKIEQFHVYSDPRARFADPSNPDRPPMPPDDDDAYKLTPHPQQPGKAGVGNVEGTAYLEIIKVWDQQSRAQRRHEAEAEGAMEKPDAGGPQGLGYAPSTGRRGPVQEFFDGSLSEQEQQGFLLNLDQAIELGVINSREYQAIREDLYLAALPVTLNRFSFAYQWAATEAAIREWAGPKSLEGYQNKWSLGSSVGFSKLFSTGALLTFALANKTVFNFTPHAFTSVSTINLDFVQPLLQGGGRAVTLEPLTQSERNLVYSIRAYGRFREQFYLSITLGSALPGTLSSAAGITGGGGGASPISVLAALGIASTDVAGQFRGYYSSLFRALDTAVDRKYVRDLEEAHKIYQAYQEGGLVSPLQVAQVTSTLLGAQNTVLKDIQDTTNALDELKLQLGIPANLPLVLDDSPARPITRQLDRFYDVVSESDAAVKRIEQQDRRARWQMRAFLLDVFTKDPLVKGTEFQKKLPVSWEIWRKANDKELDARIKELGSSRNKLLDTKTDLEMQGKTLSTQQANMLLELEFESDLGQLEKNLRKYETRPWEQKPEAEQLKERTKFFRQVAFSAEIVLAWARNERFTQASQLWPRMLPVTTTQGLDLSTANVDVAQEAAVEEALSNRWDLMNARAQVVDAWRQLAVTANALMGVLNVQYHLDSTTPPGGTRPMAFSAAATNQELIIDAQLPLVRVAQRNAYRFAIINYERARRNLMSLEDGIAAQVRFDVRQLHLFAENFKIQQKLLESLYSQVENSLEVIVAPVDPAVGPLTPAAAAALTTQYLNNLAGLNNSQTRMYDIWLSYLATRMQLYEDLERLALDERGVWIDDYATGPDAPSNANGSAAHGQRLPATQRGAAPDEPFARPRLLPPSTAQKME